MTTTLEPWKDAAAIGHSDQLKRFVYQHVEEEKVNSLPHALKQLPAQRTMNGFSTPHQMGDHHAVDMLTRGPFFCCTAHLIEILPNAPVRGVHRHIGAPTLFCTGGKGWEWNDEVTYEFETYDMLTVPPYTMHQHGGDKDLGCKVYVPETGRIGNLLALTWREQHKFSEKPTFREGTEPITDADGKLIGYRIKKGVLGIEKDVEVILGPEPSREASFQARRSAGHYQGAVKNTYDRYVKLQHDEADFCREQEHVIRFDNQPWEMTRQGKVKWVVHPETPTATNHMWIYFQEIGPGSRSGMHRHVSEELILVLEGSGYDVHDGERWDWEPGDLVCVPTMATHQHFNTGDSRALLLCALPSIYTHLGVGGIEQLEDAPEADEG